MSKHKLPFLIVTVIDSYHMNVFVSCISAKRLYAKLFEGKITSKFPYLPTHELNRGMQHRGVLNYCQLQGETEINSLKSD